VITVQVLWIPFIFVNGLYGMIVSVIAYTAISVSGIRNWRRHVEQPATCQNCESHVLP